MDMSDGMDSTFEVPKSLTIVSGVFLALGAVGMLVVAGDILLRQGWKTMMWIMIPTYIINAGYMPISIYLYWKFGRPAKPGQSHAGHMDHGAMKDVSSEKDLEGQHESHNEQSGHEQHEHHHEPPVHDAAAQAPAHTMAHDHHAMHQGEQIQPSEPQNHGHQEHHGHEGHEAHETKDAAPVPNMHHMHRMDDPNRPMWATVMIGVAHCGAGCILGDLVGEWLVFGTGITIRGHDVWPCLLVDYAFALLFGIVFQYFSIAPMSGEYGLKTVWRAAKADFLSLTSFEVGLFGWMVIYQVAIWNYQLEMNTWLYWWMMQVGMILGYFTALPVNWWLISNGIKEPCA